MKQTYYAKSSTEYYTFHEESLEAARKWVINNLDHSQQWEVAPIGIQLDDIIITRKGAGKLLKSGLEGIVKHVRGNSLFIMIGESGYNVKREEVDLKLTDNNLININTHS